MLLLLPLPCVRVHLSPDLSLFLRLKYFTFVKRFFFPLTRRTESRSEKRQIYHSATYGSYKVRTGEIFDSWLGKGGTGRSLKLGGDKWIIPYAGLWYLFIMGLSGRESGRAGYRPACRLPMPISMECGDRTWIRFYSFDNHSLSSQVDRDALSCTPAYRTCFFDGCI